MLYLISLIFFNNINVELKPYYHSYLNMLHTHCNINPAPRFTLDFKSCGEDKCIGYCLPGKLEQKVFVDREFWNRSTKFVREQLIFHELSHCILHAQHSKDKSNFMYPYTPVDISKAEFYNEVNDLMEQTCKK